MQLWKIYGRGSIIFAIRLKSVRMPLQISDDGESNEISVYVARRMRTFSAPLGSEQLFGGNL